MTGIADQAARDAALDLGRHVLAVAPAGSGKTGLLVRRALRALAACDEPEQVVCITFTRKAAAEIRHRIVQALRLAEQPPPDDAFAAGLHADARAVLAQDAARGWALRNNPSRLRATTIDAFNQRLAGALPVLSGLGGALRVHEQPRALYERAVLGAFSRLGDADLADADRDALLAVLAWANNRLDLLMGPIAELLGRRDQWLNHAADMGTTPTADDTAVLRALIETRLAAAAAQFDANTAGMLRDCWRAAAGCHDSMAWARDMSWPEATADALPLWRQIANGLLTRGGTLRKQVNRNDGFPPGSDHKEAFVDVLAALRAQPQLAELEADLAEVRDLPDPDYPADYAVLRGHLARTLLLVYAELRVLFGAGGEADFAEVAHAAVAAASGEHGADALARSDAQIRHLLVDEMQDTSESQVQLLEQLTQNWQPGDGRSLFLVGDPQQSIYGFRNAEVQLFMQMMGSQPDHADARLGGLALTVLHLQVNFRSDAALIDWFNATFSAVFPDRADAEAGVVRATPCVARPGAPGGPGVQLVAAGEDEAEQAADVVCRLLDGLEPGQRIGLLAAARPHLTPTLDALAARDVTAVQARDVRRLSDAPAVIDYLHLVRVLRQPQDRLAWVVLLRAPWVGLLWADLLALSVGRTGADWPDRLAAFDRGEVRLGDDAAARCTRLIAALHAVEPLRSDLPTAAEVLWHALGGAVCLDDGELDAVQCAMRCVREQAAGGEIADWPALERALGELYAPAGTGPVEATTIHKSKGLQYDHVVVVGCGKPPRNEHKPMLHLHALRSGNLLAPKPADEDDSGQAIYDLAHRMLVAARRNERLRLLYVAATRARHSLTLVAAAPWKATRDEAGYRVAGGSFADVLDAQFEPLFSALAPPDDTDIDDAGADPDLEWPLALRGPAQVDVAPPDLRWLPTEQRTRKPSERTLMPLQTADDAGDLLDDGNLYAQLVGTMFHQAMERVSVDGLDAWAEVGEARRRAMASGLLRMGLPPEQLDAAVDRVVTLVRRTLASDAGRWVLRDWPWWRNEYPLGGWQDGAWESAVVDRCFVDDTGVLWVVDYKTAAWPVEASPEAYAQQMQDKYAEQVARYVSLMETLRPDCAVRGALLLAETGTLLRL